MNNTSVGRIKDQTLAQYIRSHDAMEPGVLETVKGDLHDKLDYVQHALYGDEGYDATAARGVMDEARKGVKALYDTPIEGFQANAEAAAALVQRMSQEGSARIDRQVVVLRPAKEQHFEGRVADPEGLHADTSSLSGARVVSATITEDPEEANLSDYACSPEKLNQNKCYDKRTRPGLDATLELANGVTPQVQGILTDRIIQRATVARFHETEHSSSVAAGSSSSHVQGSHGFLRGTRLSGASASGFAAVSSHDREASGLAQPELIDALAGLQTLRDRIDRLTAYPSTTVNLIGRQEVSETAQVQRSVVPTQHLSGPQRLLKRIGVEPSAPEPEVRDQSITVLDDTRRRTLGSLPFVPAYFDTPDER